MKQKTLILALTLGAAIFAGTVCPAAETTPKTEEKIAEKTAEKPVEKTEEKTAEPKITAGVVALQCYSTPSGFVVNTAVTSEPQKFYDLPPLLKFNRYDPESMADSKAAALLRPPADGKVYVIFIVSVTSQHSLGKHDYLLRVGNADYSCLAIAQEGEVFDQRTIEIRNKMTRVDSTLPVFMVYEIPEGSSAAAFVPAIPQVSPKDFKSREFPLPGDSNPKAGLRKKPAATATAAVAADEPSKGQPVVAEVKDETIETSLAKAETMLQDNNFADFLKTFMPPGVQKSKNMATYIKEKGENTGMAIKSQMADLKGVKPTMGADGNTAVIKNADATVPMIKVNGRWYFDVWKK